MVAGLLLKRGKEEPREHMRIATISKSGLAAITLAVTLLWSFVITEHFVQADAMAERIVVMRELRRMGRRGNPMPVSVPSLPVPHRAHIAAG